MLLGPRSRLSRTAPLGWTFRLTGLVPRRDLLELLPSAFLVFHGLILVVPYPLDVGPHT